MKPNYLEDKAGEPLSLVQSCQVIIERTCASLCPLKECKQREAVGERVKEKEKIKEAVNRSVILEANIVGHNQRTNTQRA
jgi:hypothetical protein